MSEIKISGIVSRTTDFGEYDRMITILSPDGRFDLNLKGCRKQKAKLRPAGQLFAFGDFVLLERNGHYIMTAADIKESFFDLAKDYNAFYDASKLCVLMNDLYVFSADSSNELFSLFIRSLIKITYERAIDTHVLLLNAVFSAFSIVGILPALDICSVCGKKILDPKYFSVREGGLVCEMCKHQNQFMTVKRVSSAGVNLLRSFGENSIDDTCKLSIDRKTVDEIQGILEDYATEHLEKRYVF